MAKVTLKHSNERFESLMRRFKKAVERDDILREVKDREQFEKPSVRRKRARAAAKKRTQREHAERMANSPVGRKRKF